MAAQLLFQNFNLVERAVIQLSRLIVETWIKKKNQEECRKARRGLKSLPLPAITVLKRSSIYLEASKHSFQALNGLSLSEPMGIIDHMVFNKLTLEGMWTE